MFIIALFVITKNWKRPKYLSSGEWVRKVQYIHIVEYHSAIRTNKW